ncbi:hypothetical protein BC833DRAFT_613377 [Globomyces pollinis-pini]|nr:hypothetical protein BC833DRAFT_613377 [Globomyces pollinis-pini]
MIDWYPVVSIENDSMQIQPNYHELIMIWHFTRPFLRDAIRYIVKSEKPYQILNLINIIFSNMIAPSISINSSTYH